jgi:hypothetical protein
MAVVWSDDGLSISLLFPAQGVGVPKSGDYVRLNDGPGLATDAAGNRPGPQSRFRIITGDKRTGIKTITYNEISSNPVVQSGPIFVLSRETTGTTIKEVVEKTGRMGFLLELELGDFTSGDGFTPVEPSQVRLDYNVALFSNLGTPIASETHSLPCTDLLFNGDCRMARGKIFLGWNYTSKNGQKIGTGAYVSTLQFQVKVNGKPESTGKIEEIWGILRRD